MELPSEGTNVDDGIVDGVVDGVRDGVLVLAPSRVLLVDGGMDDHLIGSALGGVDDDGDEADGVRDGGLIMASFERV